LGGAKPRSTDVEGCPQRYALARASYPDLWDGRAYPPLPTAPALFGNVVHGALQIVVNALAAAGVESSQAIEATEVLRGLGGLTAVVERGVAAQLDLLDTNPRIDEARRRRIARELRAQTPDARVQVQTYLSRTVFGSSTPDDRGIPAGGGSGQGQPSRRRALGEGAHPEVSLAADGLRLRGRIDLLTIAGNKVDIVDYSALYASSIEDPPRSVLRQRRQNR